MPKQRALRPHGEGGDAQQDHLRIWTLGKIPDERPEEREGEQDEPFDYQVTDERSEPALQRLSRWQPLEVERAKCDTDEEKQNRHNCPHQQRHIALSNGDADKSILPDAKEANILPTAR
jgi:hypothetical protein